MCPGLFPCCAVWVIITLLYVLNLGSKMPPDFLYLLNIALSIERFGVLFVCLGLLCFCLRRSP